MRNRWMKKSLCLACVGLSLVLARAGGCQTAVGAGHSGTASVLERAQRENDPELSELIRIALTHRKGTSEQERFEIMRKVTQSYTQIKLLDQQVEQIGRKIEATAGPADMRYEMVLAKAELEAKRAMELANLRELLGIIPRFPFESQPIPTLNTWLSVQPVNEQVLVLDGVKPFSQFWAMERYQVAGVLSEKETLDYVRTRLQDKNGLPIRLDIYYKPETNSTCLKLRDAICLLAQGAGAEMRTEVRLMPREYVGSGESPFFIRKGKIRALYPLPVRRPDGGAKLLTTGVVEPNNLEQSILWRLTSPKNVPLRFRIEYDEASAKLAKGVADVAKAVAKRLGLAELVEVTEVLTDPVPEATFLGRWEAIRQGEIQTLDVQPGGVCKVTMGKGSQAVPAGEDVSGTWLPTTKEIIVDVNDKTKTTHYLYPAAVNAEGDLVVEKGVIFSQGSFTLSNTGQTIFKKVY
jgi:hypothetical protein